MIPIKVPPLGESIVEATVSQWVKQPGEAVAAGDTVVELETDKVNVEVPALKAGVLSSQAKKEGETVKVDDVLGQLDENAVPATVAATAGAKAAATPTTATPTSATPSAATAGGSRPAPTGVRASPAAQKVAADQKIDLAGVRGTGRGGVVSKADVIDRANNGTPSGTATNAVAVAGTAFLPPAASGDRETREKMTTRRKRIAENLLQSQLQTAHLTTFNEIDMSAVSALRERLRDRIEKTQGVKLSYMPFFVRAACQALKDFPTVNAQIDGDSIIYRHYVNLGVAVAADQGLVVPVIRDADRKGMLDVARAIAALGARGRDGKLTIEDLTGGTFTITNGGVFGSLVSTPILNYPQVGILGLHKIQDRPVAVNGQVVIRPMMYVALSYDHRLVEGAHAVQFLVRVKELMEDPAAMLIG